MKLHELRPDPGAHKPRKRKGIGISAGQGKTAGRGTKGQHARSGGVKGPYFEGGQLPLVRRLPFKRGFTNIFRVVYQEVNLEDLARVFSAGAAVTPATLQAHGLIQDAEQPVVLLGRGEPAARLDVSVHRVSQSARQQIEQAGGSVTLLELPLPKVNATVKKLRKGQLAALRAKQTK